VYVTGGELVVLDFCRVLERKAMHIFQLSLMDFLAKVVNVGEPASQLAGLADDEVFGGEDFVRWRKEVCCFVNIKW
jgi:hypothetical protein